MKNISLLVCLVFSVAAVHCHSSESDSRYSVESFDLSDEYGLPWPLLPRPAPRPAPRPIQQYPPQQYPPQQYPPQQYPPQQYPPQQYPPQQYPPQQYPPQQYPPQQYPPQQLPAVQPAVQPTAGSQAPPAPAK